MLNLFPHLSIPEYNDLWDRHLIPITGNDAPHIMWLGKNY